MTKVTPGRLEKSKHYQPYVVDVENSQLEQDLYNLASMLAENEHDKLANCLILQGYKLGPIHNENDRTSPMLMAFGDLEPEDQEKYIDQMRCLLKTIQKLGYKIVKK